MAVLTGEVDTALQESVCVEVDRDAEYVESTDWEGIGIGECETIEGVWDA